MREQVISPRNARRSVAQSRGLVQRPARRDGSSERTRSFSPRMLFGYLPIALKVVLAVVVVVAAVVGYHAAASASLFQVRAIDVTGTARTSKEEIESLTRRAVSRTGVWRADLSAISNELSRLPGVRRAVVSRVLPDGLRVRITERVPVAVIRTAAGHFVWVDDDGVALGEMKPDDQMPVFFIRGWNEDGTEDGRQDNAERIRKYQELVREWSALGLSERVSEVTLIDLRDVRVQLAGNDSQIEVRLGSKDLGRRLKIALEELDVYKQAPGGSSITYVDLQTGRVVIGFGSGSRITAASPNESQSAAANPELVSNVATSDTPKTRAGTAATKANRQKEKDKDKPSAQKPRTNTPRAR